MYVLSLKPANFGGQNNSEFPGSSLSNFGGTNGAFGQSVQPFGAPFQGQANSNTSGVIMGAVQPYNTHNPGQGTSNNTGLNMGGLQTFGAPFQGQGQVNNSSVNMGGMQPFNAQFPVQINSVSSGNNGGGFGNFADGGAPFGNTPFNNGGVNQQVGVSNPAQTRAGFGSGIQQQSYMNTAQPMSQNQPFGNQFGNK